jgi:hypothetical protein
MRQTIKVSLGALLALLALSALASASASAATCKKGSLEAEHKTLCVEGQQVGSPSKTVLTTSTFKLKTGASVVFESLEQGWGATCSSLRTREGFIESGGEGNVKLTKLAFSFEGCKVTVGGGEVAECEVVSFTTNPLASSLALPEKVALRSGLTNEAFMELEIRGGCPEAGNYPIYGSQPCTLKQPEVEAVAKELVCEAKTSKLELRHGQGGAATLKLEGNVELIGTSKGKKFSITK